MTLMSYLDGRKAGWPDEFLEKIAPKYGPTHFLSKLIHNFFRGKKLPKLFGYFCNFRKNGPMKPIAQ
jgi:hypothetical protein